METIQQIETVDDLMLQISRRGSALPRRLRQCADYISENADEIAFATVAELSERAQVQPSAMMRFCQVMGFAGYSDMQKLFRANISPRITDYSERIENLRKGGADSPLAILAEFVEAGRQSLENLSTTVNPLSLDQAVDALAQAEMIHIVGLRRAYPVASYLSYAFEKLHIPSMLHGGAGRLTHNEALRKGDVLIAITFAPYSPETIALADEAALRGLPVVVMSDTLSLPMETTSFVPLIVSEIDFGAFRSLSASLSLAISLAVATGARRSRGK